MNQPNETISLPGKQDMSRARTAWRSLLFGSVIFFFAVYAIAVLTRFGQLFENSALAGSKLSPNNLLAVDDAQLRVISVSSLAIAIVLVALIGYVRGGWRLGVAGSGTIILSVGIAEVLKHYVLPRPDLVGAQEGILHNSFPSGHTTIAMSFLMALLLVVPFRWRGLAMLVTLGWATGIGALTVAAHWHRLSDTLGANAVALAVASAASLWLLKDGKVKPAPPKRYPLRVALAWLFAVTGAGALLIGVTLALLNWYRVPQGSPDFAINNYLAVHSLALAGSVISALTFWRSWHGLETL